jgi:DNA-directed RNA polymerase subunit beta'
VPERKAEILELTTIEVDKAEQQYRRGLITEEELYNKTVELWTRATDEVTDAVKELLSPIEGLGAMARSGATKGGINPVRQLAGMRGLMADPNGRIIPLPIRSNFREGLTALEYFLSTHGARKGLADTALRTADAGYLTRRLVDVAQDVIITEEDCNTNTGIWITAAESKAMQESFSERIAGRFLAPMSLTRRRGEVLLPRNELLTEAALETLKRHKVEKGLCAHAINLRGALWHLRHCYGEDLARGGIIKMGEAVGIVAAQSIGEPGTQLTLRTFHTGGVAGATTSRRVCRASKNSSRRARRRAKRSSPRWTARCTIQREGDVRILRISRTDLKRREVKIPASYAFVISDGDRVQEDTVIARKAWRR